MSDSDAAQFLLIIAAGQQLGWAQAIIIIIIIIIIESYAEYNQKWKIYINYKI